MTLSVSRLPSTWRDFIFSVVVVDIGTNFYVEKTRPEAIEFFDRKIKYVEENMEKIMPQMVQKNQSRNLVESEIVQKMKAAKLAKPSK